VASTWTAWIRAARTNRFAGRGSDAALCDEDGGIDNQLVAITRLANYDIGTRYEANVEAGTAGIILGISLYSGDPSDPHVYLSSFLSGGIVAHDCVGNQPGADAATDAAPIPAAFDGCDVFGADPQFASGGSLTFDLVPAAVVDGTLIVDEPFRFWLSLGSRFIPVQASHLEAVFEKEADGVVVMKGDIGGIATPEAILPHLAEQPLSPTNSTPICQDPLRWLFAHDTVCAQRDAVRPKLVFLSDGGALPNDGAGPNDGGTVAPCEGLSFGFKFKAFPMRLGVVEKELGAVKDKCTLDASEYRCE
jgi:hypothetical protein